MQHRFLFSFISVWSPSFCQLQKLGSRMWSLQPVLITNYPQSVQEKLAASGKYWVDAMHHVCASSKTLAASNEFQADAVCHVCPSLKTLTDSGEYQADAMCHVCPSLKTLTDSGEYQPDVVYEGHSCFAIWFFNNTYNPSVYSSFLKKLPSACTHLTILSNQLFMTHDHADWGMSKMTPSMNARASSTFWNCFPFSCHLT